MVHCPSENQVLNGFLKDLPGPRPPLSRRLLSRNIWKPDYFNSRNQLTRVRIKFWLLLLDVGMYTARLVLIVKSGTITLDILSAVIESTHVTLPCYGGCWVGEK